MYISVIKGLYFESCRLTEHIWLWVNSLPCSHTIWPGGVDCRHLCRQMILPSEKVRTAWNDGSQGAVPCQRCPAPAVVVKVIITSVEDSLPEVTLLRSKAIWKMISKVTFQMVLLLNEASTPSDIRSQLRHLNRRVESSSAFERGQVCCFWFGYNMYILASLTLSGCLSSCNALKMMMMMMI